MSYKEKLQAFVDDLQAVCDKHQLGLTGTCISEGISGEMCILDPLNPEDAAIMRGQLGVFDSGLFDGDMGGEPVFFIGLAPHKPEGGAA